MKTWETYKQLTVLTGRGDGSGTESKSFPVTATVGPKFDQSSTPFLLGLGGWRSLAGYQQILCHHFAPERDLMNVPGGFKAGSRLEVHLELIVSLSLISIVLFSRLMSAVL